MRLDQLRNTRRAEREIHAIRSIADRHEGRTLWKRRRVEEMCVRMCASRFGAIRRRSSYACIAAVAESARTRLLCGRTILVPVLAEAIALFSRYARRIRKLRTRTVDASLRHVIRCRVGNNDVPRSPDGPII